MASTETVLARADYCRRAAQYGVAQLLAMGFTGGLRETGGHSAIVAHHPGMPGNNGPRWLHDGQDDVQPADPLELWTSSPFEPTRVGGPHGDRVHARGGVDDKGQVSMWLGALRAWHDATGSLPCPVTVLIEGEEETGSVTLKPFVKAIGDELKADICIQVPGFCNGVQDISATKANQWAALGVSEEKFLGDIGLSISYGETDRGPLERLWARPTCDICDIWGGYTGPGTKTMIASAARRPGTLAEREIRGDVLSQGVAEPCSVSGEGDKVSVFF